MGKSMIYILLSLWLGKLTDRYQHDWTGGKQSYKIFVHINQISTYYIIWAKHKT